MSRENPLWGAPRIHGELLMLGFDVAQSTVSKYMVRRNKPPSQSWRTFLLNHADALASIDMCMVPTVKFERLFAVLILGHGRRQLLWFEVTRRVACPTDHGSLSLGISANVEPSNDTVPLPPFPSWRDCTIATCGSDFRTGQLPISGASRRFSRQLPTRS